MRRFVYIGARFQHSHTIDARTADGTGGGPQATSRGDDEPAAQVASVLDDALAKEMIAKGRAAQDARGVGWEARAAEEGVVGNQQLRDRLGFSSSTRSDPLPRQRRRFGRESEGGESGSRDAHDALLVHAGEAREEEDGAGAGGGGKTLCPGAGPIEPTDVHIVCAGSPAEIDRRKGPHCLVGDVRVATA